MKQKIYSFLFFTVLVFLPSSIWAQRTIIGTVTDAESGETLIGANILVKGTTTGVVTDIDGKYEILLPKDANTLVISYTGYTEIEREVEATNILDVEMSAGSVLDEVVVIGYGTVKREDATGSIQTISSKEFNKGAITSAQELLAGKVAGVQITTNSGAPGDGAVIRIRGGSSLFASNDPLIVIDGVPIDNGGVSGGRNALNVINPNDIETFTVLKDASATAIYGSRASNGVILITTKKGALGKKLRVNYSGNISFSKNIENFSVYSADEFQAVINEQYPEGHPARDILGTASTDWQSEIYETGVGTDQNISLSGGINDFLPYRISLGYTDKNGVLIGDKFQRSTVALNLTPSFLENKLQINFNLKSAFTKNDFADRGAIGNANAFDPTQPILDVDSPYGGFYTITNEQGLPNGLAPANPLALLNLRDDRSDVQRWIVNGSVDYRMPFLPELRANLSLGYDYSKGEGTIDIPDFASFSFDALTGGGTDNEYRQEKKNELAEFYLNYAKEFGEIKVDLLGGYSWQRFFFEDSFKNSDIAGTEITEGENTGELFLLSYYGRLNLTVFDNLLITGTLRRDASSRFSPDNRWGTFPAAAIAYKILSDAPGTINNLKLRLGYGITGQQDVGGYYQHLPRYLGGFPNAQYQFGDTFVTTLRPEGYDANIKWEETTTYNVGLEYSLFKERIYGEIEYYNRKTKDLLNNVPLPAGTNLTNILDTNVGDLENKGFEISVNTVPVKKDKLRWELGVNFTRNENKITRLIASDDPNYLGVLTGGIAGGVGSTIQIHSVGFPASSFFVYEQVYDEVGNPVEGLYVDRNGDGSINSEDLYQFKKPAPDYFFGFRSNLTIGNFGFSFAGRANVGNYVYNNVQSDQAFLSRFYHPTNYLLNSHTDATVIGFQNPEYLSDHYIQEASFLRIDFVSADYRFDDVFGKGYSIALTATIQNPLLVTDYTGIDPEISSGIDGNTYPRVRTFLLGVNANF